MADSSTSNPLELLKEELDNDDIQIKVNGVHRLPIILALLSKDKIVSEVIPFIQKILPSEEDEVLLAFSEEMGNFKNFIDDRQIIHILPIFQFLFGCEETVVRDSAVKGLKKIIESLSDEQVQKDIIPMVIQISGLEAFQYKVSACCLIRSCYPKAGKEKEKLRALYFKFCDDETPIIKRTAAKEFGPLCLVIDKEHINSDMIPYYKKFMLDNDSVRVTILPSLVQLIKLSQNTELQKMNIQFIIGASEDKSWRVRNELSKIFPEFAQAFGSQINEIVPTLANLIKDSETEVRLNALKGLNIILPSINSEKVGACLINSLIYLNNESSHEVKACMGETFGLIARSVGYSAFNSKLGKLMDSLMKSENADVRLGIAKSMYGIFISSEGSLITSINALLGTMQKDPQYRIRECVYETLAKLGVNYGLEVFKSSIDSLYFNYCSDNVASVREVGVNCLGMLIEKFGSAWVTSGLVPKLQSFLTAPKTSYLNRMCIIHSLCICGKYLEPKQNTEFLYPIIGKSLKDKIANVRFYTLKLLQGITKYFDPSMREKIKLLAKDLCGDEDNDVKYYAGRFLETL